MCVHCSTITQPKPVQKHGSAGGSSTSTAGKKKEFDPSQSLVYQMLQEEGERAKRGDVSEPVEEEPSSRRQPPQQQQLQPAWRRRPQPQQGSRLQDLLEKDRAEAQQEEDEQLQYVDKRPQPPGPQPQPPRQPTTHTHHNQQRMQPSQPAGSSYHAAPVHQESTYMKGSLSGGYYQQPTNTLYEEYYQRGNPTRGQNPSHMTSYYSSYGQESVPISDF